MNCETRCRGECSCRSHKIYRILRSTGITSVPGTSMTIIAFAENLVDGKIYELFIGDSLPTIQGIEPVSISINGVLYPVIDSFRGDLVVSGRLRGAHLDKCNCVMLPFRLRLVFGSNGMPSGVAHFTAFSCDLCDVKYYGPVGSPQPPVTGN